MLMRNTLHYKTSKRSFSGGIFSRPEDMIYYTFMTIVVATVDCTLQVYVYVQVKANVYVQLKVYVYVKFVLQVNRLARNMHLN